ncbi:roadblock/LC7 domain-containing protein [Streptomyces sp. NPDC003860]
MDELMKQQIEQILTNKLTTVGHVKSALVVSADGLEMYRYEMTQDLADAYAAAVSGMASLANGLARAGEGGAVIENVTRMENHYLVIMRAADNAHLVCITTQKPDLGMVTLQMKQLVRDLAKVLSADARPTEGAVS